jgi:parallel beta-helix repeat protein/predicted outer membrane repeat protein
VLLEGSAATLTGNTISGNIAGWGGGLQASYSSPVISGNTFEGNTVVYDGGGLNLGGCDSVTLRGNVIDSNSSGRYGGGIFTDGTATMDNCTVRGNSALTQGGGIYNKGTLTVADTAVSDNSARYDGGGIYSRNVLVLENSIVEGNSLYDPFAHDGSGICNWMGSIALTGSTVRGNTHGGIRNDGAGTLILINSSVSGNTGTGVSNEFSLLKASTVTLDTSSISNNTGTGIRNLGGNLALNNSTISSNGSGGITTWHGTADLSFCTVSANTSTDGGGISSDGSAVTLLGTILAGNSASVSGMDCSGTVGSAGYNLVGDTSGCVFTPTTGDLTNVDPELGPLEGSPAYHPLLMGSPAIDSVPVEQCVFATDQRGVVRPQGPACDIGAYEWVPE